MKALSLFLTWPTLSNEESQQSIAMRKASLECY